MARILPLVLFDEEGGGVGGGAWVCLTCLGDIVRSITTFSFPREGGGVGGEARTCMTGCRTCDSFACVGGAEREETGGGGEVAEEVVEDPSIRCFLAG